PRRHRQSDVVDVAGYTDDSEQGVGALAVAERDVLAERRDAGPESLRGRLVDHDDVARATTVGLGELAALHDRNAQRPEVIRARDVEARAEVAAWRIVAAWNAKAQVVLGAAQRKVSDERSRFHTGQLTGAIEQRVVVRAATRGTLESRLGQPHRGDQRLRRVE